MNVSKISSICDYHGEYSSFGEEGWKIAYKFFEYGSRIALLKKDTLRRLEATSDSEARREILRFCRAPTENDQEALFHEAKFVHCFLNQMGYTRIKDDVSLEAMFHLDSFFERMSAIGRSLSQAQGLLRNRIEAGFGSWYFRR